MPFFVKPRFSPEDPSFLWFIPQRINAPYFENRGILYSIAPPGTSTPKQCLPYHAAWKKVEKVTLELLGETVWYGWLGVLITNWTWSTSRSLVKALWIEKWEKKGKIRKQREQSERTSWIFFFHFVHRPGYRTNHWTSMDHYQPSLSEHCSWVLQETKPKGSKSP